MIRERQKEKLGWRNRRESKEERREKGKEIPNQVKSSVVEIAKFSPIVKPFFGGTCGKGGKKGRKEK